MLSFQICTVSLFLWGFQVFLLQNLTSRPVVHPNGFHNKTLENPRKTLDEPV